jgi:RNA polymerase sigma-70 factor, ECF subfamily
MAFTTEQLLRWQPNLQKFARKLLNRTKNLPITYEDLVQETFLRALSKQHQFDGGDLRAWLFAILYSLYINICRHENRMFAYQPLEGVLELESIIDDRQQTEINAIIQDIVKGFEKLTKSQKDLLNEIIFNDISYDECAAKYNLPIGTVRSRLTRGRAKLERLIDY